MGKTTSNVVIIIFDKKILIKQSSFFLKFFFSIKLLNILQSMTISKNVNVGLKCCKMFKHIFKIVCVTASPCVMYGGFWWFQPANTGTVHLLRDRCAPVQTGGCGGSRPGTQVHCTSYVLDCHLSLNVSCPWMALVIEPQLSLNITCPWMSNFTNVIHIYWCIVSSPEHKVLMVSYCDRALSVVRRRPSSVVRRA